MAEETLNNVENLNSQPSKINQLLSESDFLNPASVEQPLAPKINWQDNFSNPTNYIKDNTSGISPNYPPSQVRKSRQEGLAKNTVSALLDQTMARIDGMSDVSTYAEPYAYDATPNGTFRARYKAYGQDTFNKIGFHPLIDNETYFNQNTTFGDDLKRWATHSAWPMLSKGFMDPINSYKSIMQGNGLFDADEQSARDYEYYNALGSSSKGGLGGFTVNLFNSASYSMGILLEGAVEGALIGGLFGGGNPATGAIEGSTTFLSKLGKLPRALMESTEATAKLISSVKNYSNLSKAKELYVSASKNFGNFINPLHNTAEAYKQLKNTDNLTNLARSATTAGALWHDVMSMNMALSEGKLEGGFTRYQTYDKLYNKYVAEHNGKAPSSDEQENMMREASKASFWNTLSNTGLIFLSNKLVFPSITNASFLKGMPKFGFGKVVTNVGKDYQILFEPGKKALEGAFTKQKISFTNAIKSLAKPATYGKVGLNYFKANVVEGGQEILQDALQEATQNYYVETYKNPDARNQRYAAGYLAEAIGKQWSAQGLETFLSGFLMGSVLQAPGVMKKYATVGYNDYFKKDSNYKAYLDGREELADTMVNQLNTMYKNGQYFFDPRINNYANQSALAKVIDNPDDFTTKEIRDTEFAAFQSAVLGSLQNGTFNMFLKHYEGYKQASATDIEEAWNLKPGQGEKALERFDKSLENANEISKRWNTAKDKMKFMANLDDYEKDTEEYKMADIYNKAYNQALYNYVFLHNSFDDNVRREKKLYETLSSLSAIKESSFSDFAGFTDPNRLQREIEMMKTEVENLESFGTSESLEQASRKRELVELYSNFQERQEKLVDLFVNKSILSSLKAEIIAENPDMSLEDVGIAAIDKLINDYDSGKSNEFLDYKEVFNNLLTGLADTPAKKMQLEQEMQKMGGIDDLFTDLLDTHILRIETARLAEYVNLLSNPRDFYEHVTKNFKFMKDLYNNREEVVKDIVNQEISAIENNTLLNTLAEQGIFIDLEEFSKWVENPRYFPESFIDVTNNRMINKGSILYEEYIELFIRAAELAEKKPAGEPLTQKQLLDKRIQAIESERGDLLSAEREKYDAKFKDKYGVTVEEYLQQESERIASEELTDEQRKDLEAEKKLLTKASATLESDNPVEVEASALVIAEKLENEGVNIEEFFNSKVQELQVDPAKKKQVADLSKKYDVSDIEDPQEAITTSINAALQSIIYGEYAATRLGEIETELNKKPAAPSIDVENTKEFLAYQEAVDAINEKYDAIIADIKDEFKKKGVDENTPDNYTTKTEFEDFDTEYQEEITTLFDAYLVDVLQEDIAIKNSNPQEYERLRANWLERQGALIEKFNETAQQKAAEIATKLAKPPKLKFIDLQITNENTAYSISNIIKKLQKFLENGEYPNPKNLKQKIQLTPEDIKIIKADIEALNGYLNARVLAGEPTNIAEETMNIIQENIIDKQNEIIEIFDEDGNVIGRTFKDRQPGDPTPDRTTQVAEEVENSLKGKDSFLYNPIKPVVDKEGNTSPSPVENMYNQFFKDPDVAPEDRVRLFMDAFKKEAFRGWKEFKFQEKLDAVENSLKTVGTYENLRDTIKKFAFKESSDAGDYVDGLIRIFLTLNAANASKFSEFTYGSTVQLKGRDIKISEVMSRKAFDKLFAPVTPTSPGGIITKFRLGVIDGTYRILSENVKLFDKNLRDGKGVTGEVDLLLLREDGSVAIVDIKTKKLKERKGKLVSGWADFGDPNAKYESSTYFRAQQSIYGYQFYNSTGITPDIKLMPFDMLLSKDKIGYIDDIDLAEIVATGDDTVDLEYLPEIEDFGIVKIKPEIKAPVKKTTDTGGPVSIGIAESDPSKNKISENVNKPVVYNGRLGKLVIMSSGIFGIEVVVNNDITTLQLTLDTLEANLTMEKGSFGNADNILELEKNITRLQDAIKSSEGVTQVFPLQVNGKNVSDGDLTLADAGLSLVISTDSVGQVSTVNGEVINASFSNENETIAVINGVKYDVLRDDSGNITALSYMSNDKEISNIDKQSGAISKKIGDLRNSLSNEETESDTKDSIISRISKLQSEIKALSSKRTDLYNSNKKIYVYGENANNYIFALNRLPNSFQRLTRNNTKANETQDLKSIDNLSLSRTIATTITEILSENYPEVLDTLIEKGAQALKKADLNTITTWVNETIKKLESLGYTVINRGDLVDDITNQINALNDLLNDMQLINLTKNGRISKKQEIADQVFGPGSTEVQKGSSVPKNEGTTRSTTKGVLRPATRKELEDLIKKSREENLGDTFEEPVDNEINDQIAELIKLKDLISKTDDLAAIMDAVFKILDETKYEAWQGTLNEKNLEKDLKDKMVDVQSQTEAYNIVSKYLLAKFIDTELAALEKLKPKEVLGALNEINNATLDTIEEVYEKAFLDATAKGEKTGPITDAYIKRMTELKTIVSMQNVNKGEYLISKNPIFTDVSEEIVIVVSKNKKSVTLKNIDTDETRKFTEEELIENFEKTTMESREPEVPVIITPVDVEDSNASKDTIKNLIANDAEAIANAKVQSRASNKKSRLSKLSNNSKLC